MTEEMTAQRVSVACTDHARAQRLREAVGKHIDDVWRFLRRLGLSTADADDAVQDVMIVFARKLDLVVQGSEKSFLFGTALRFAMRTRRSRSRLGDGNDEILELQEDPGPAPDAPHDDQQAREVLDELLDTLPIDLRAVFVLAEVEEMTAAQIAELLELAPGTVASRLRRARDLFDGSLARLHARWRFEGGQS